MTTEHISRAPDGGINEDLIAVFESRGATDLIVLDGATSVADADYVDGRQGDVAWFVQAFAAELGRAIETGLAQGAAVRLAVDAVRRVYHLKAGDTAVPLYAHPLAALTWIRVRPMADHLALSLYCLGDCKAFALDGDGAVLDLDPYVNPHEAVVQEAIAALGVDGAGDPAIKRARLLPMLRARREAQHGSPAPDVLCLAPQGAFSARAYELRLPSDTAVLAMTDGFYRLVDPYGLYDIAALARRCRSDGLAPLMDELRAFERARADAALAVKNADDASALLWTRTTLKEHRYEPAGPDSSPLCPRQGKTLNRHLKYAAAFCFAIGLASPGMASAQEARRSGEVRVVVVNVERLLVDSKRARDAAARIDAEFLPRRDQIAAQLRQLRALSDKLDQDALHLDDREKLVRSRAVGELERTIRRAQAQISDDFAERTASERAVLAERIHAIVQKLPAQLGVDVVLTRTVWHRPQLDVTDQVGAMLDR